MRPERNYPRIAIEITVTVFTSEAKIVAQAEQLGAGGMSLRTPARISIAQPVELQFNLPGGPSIHIPAVVWWKQGDRIGLRFDMMTHQRAEIGRWIEGRLQAARYYAKPI